MKLINNDAERICQENKIYEAVLSLDGKHILELGCGNGYTSRAIATTGKNRNIVAMEVDQIQHHKNLQITDLPNVRFALAGGEDIPEDDNSFDVVFMFKSLHHVPMEQMDATLNEIHRVLKPKGIAYISEPIFAGDFNQVLRLFHDEEVVRKAAFNALKKAVEQDKFKSEQQIFFNTPRHYANFEDFESRVIHVTHTNHQLSAQHLQKVREEFSQHSTINGADFLAPMRVDLLQSI